MIISIILGVIVGIAICKEEAKEDEKEQQKKEYANRRLSRDRFNRRLYMEDGVWLCEVEEAPSCNSRGDTPEEALRYSREYVQKYLDGYED